MNWSCHLDVEDVERNEEGQGLWRKWQGVADMFIHADPKNNTDTLEHSTGAGLWWLAGEENRSMHAKRTLCKQNTRRS